MTLLLHASDVNKVTKKYTHCVYIHTQRAFIYSFIYSFCSHRSSSSIIIFGHQNNWTHTHTQCTPKMSYHSRNFSLKHTWFFTWNQLLFWAMRVIGLPKHEMYNINPSNTRVLTRFFGKIKEEEKKQDLQLLANHTREKSNNTLVG